MVEKAHASLVCRAEQKEVCQSSSWEKGVSIIPFLKTCLVTGDTNVDFVQPVKDEKELQISSRRLPLPTRGLCGRDGLVSCSMTLPRTAFVPGEYLFAEAHIHNLTSGHKIRKVRCVFNQVLTYRTENKHTRRTHRTICQSHGDDVKSGSHQTWAVSDLLIPTVPPSHLAHLAPQQSRMIDVTYELQLELDVQSQSMSVAIPVTIGTMPPLESCLTLWAHRDATAFKSKRKASPRPPAKDVSCACPEQQPCVDFCPKYRSYKVAPPVKDEASNSDLGLLPILDNLKGFETTGHRRTLLN
ncbi:hypothetical protein CAPTEDRAFT_225301 [Capitella teleta]|uniref:Arrestin C-terminal-like domain-containing protein n=1 Tax=Capitella teleta TaxID=283909 RepID=R7VCC1_CAPTE|nr:hypothetical protein CAPTEDRAFT_225301 [Capitella teleta]|eukprot:ELU16269.1 hypothetical protein CAPTEDRAFT_225301 [Capitella teleta]